MDRFFRNLALYTEVAFVVNNIGDIFPPKKRLTNLK